MSIRFPIVAIVSILHRISGVVLFLFIPILICTLDKSLAGVEEFNGLVQFFANAWVKFITWGFLALLLYHLVAGLRHILMDMGLGETKEGGVQGAYLMLLLAVIVIILAGLWIW